MSALFETMRILRRDKSMDVLWRWMNNPVTCACHDATYRECPDWTWGDPQIITILAAEDG